MKPASLSNLRRILLYLIFTVIITTMPFIMTPNLDNNNNIAKVTADAIDNILSPYQGPISILKMDIEGAEVMALRGATETLKRTGRIVIEVHKPEYIELIKEILIKNGFSSHILDDEADKQIYVIGLR